MDFTKALVWAETGVAFETATGDYEMNAAGLRSAANEPALLETRDSSGVFLEPSGDGQIWREIRLGQLTASNHGTLPAEDYRQRHPKATSTGTRLNLSGSKQASLVLRHPPIWGAGEQEPPHATRHREFAHQTSSVTPPW
ncbi:hypothetical protein, variant [Exophiala xenobiotica]|uniref:Uncharacterized protein n=1 Tax=Exophiala xenobiotica TaxID=348802 RepID=A0A0D2ECH3_9EURO|nr:hypothetical protein, variant [Exophiala xenobiotica]XP_013312985.1 uncharacterized protein PV05_08040 [Exophiala xenobiotica]KIW52400.1 hypothetical protein PV05_08040 [Exophiala xenobiotica]KIW52401.1 hypothetical protein, variant [Exophiala xenobiotica]